MSGLTNGYVESLGKKHCKNFLGVFPCNIQPKINKTIKRFSLIFNESKHDEEGSHFIAIFLDKNKLYYFDSLGLKCENDYILKFLNKFSMEIVENNKQIQSYNSIFCGYFCLAFVTFMTTHNDLKKFLNIFNEKNLKLNDKIVVELIINMLN